MAERGSSAGATIVAIASAAGAAERGILRVSGADARGLLDACCTRDGARLPAERGGYDARFDDGRGQQPVHVLWMPGPRSFTREDLFELHLPGAAPLLACALERLLALGARPAQAGEFTRRAFENGRIDLTRAEGVLALVAARSRAERRAATALLLGGLAERTDRMRAGLDELRALCEASLDFDEDDTGHIPASELAEQGRALRAQIEEAHAWEERRSNRAGEPRVVLAGAPNAGKSTLFNVLTGGSALVSPRAGTTRDLLVGVWEVAGVPCRLVDTAGLDGRGEGVDAEAQSVAERELAGADLTLWVVDPAQAGAGAPPAGPCIVLHSKADLRPGGAAEGAAGLPVSAQAGSGLEQLAARAADALGLSRERPEGSAGLGRELDARHRQALGAAARELDQAFVALDEGLPLDLFAQHLREATTALDAIRGRTTAEDLLTRIFARFCLGK